jgi:hypothetical protein
MAKNGPKLKTKNRGACIFTPKVLPLRKLFGMINVAIQEYLSKANKSVLEIDPEDFLAQTDAGRQICSQTKSHYNKNYKGRCDLKEITDNLLILLYRVGIFIETNDANTQFLFDQEQMNSVKNSINNSKFPKIPSPAELQDRIDLLLAMEKITIKPTAKSPTDRKRQNQAKTQEVIKEVLAAAFDAKKHPELASLSGHIADIVVCSNTADTDGAHIHALEAAEAIASLVNRIEEESIELLEDTINADDSELGERLETEKEGLREERTALKTLQEEIAEREKEFQISVGAFKHHARKQAELLQQALTQLPDFAASGVSHEHLLPIYQAIDTKLKEISEAEFLINDQIENLTENVIDGLKESLRLAKRAEMPLEVTKNETKLQKANQALQALQDQKVTIDEVSTNQCELLRDLLRKIGPVITSLETIRRFEKDNDAQAMIDKLSLVDIEAIEVPEIEELDDTFELEDEQEDDEWEEDEQADDPFDSDDFDPLDEAEESDDHPSLLSVQVIKDDEAEEPENIETDDQGNDGSHNQEVLEICRNIERIDINNDELSEFQMLVLKMIACYDLASKITYCTGTGKNKKSKIRGRIVHSIFAKMINIGLVSVEDYNDREKQLTLLRKAIPILLEQGILKKGPFVPKIKTHSNILILGKKLDWMQDLMSIDLQLTFMDQLSDQDKKYEE